MKRFSLVSVVMALLISALSAQDMGRGALSVGYDEGLACRYFFTEQMAGQISVGFEHLGGYDATPNNGNATVESENNTSLGLGILYNFMSSEYIYLDAIGQMAIAHDGTRDPNEVGARNAFFIRAALAPEILLANHLGLGMRFGIEMVVVGESKRYAGPLVVETDDGHTDFRFYAPKNPFDGSTLGMSLFVYF